MMLKILEWATRQPQNWQATFAVKGIDHFAQGHRTEVQCLMSKFQQILSPLSGTIVIGNSREPAARIVRLAFAKAVFNREIESYNNLTLEEQALLMGLLLEQETFALIMLDIREMYDRLLKQTGHRNRPEVRESLVQRAGGVCEAWANRDRLNIDWREQPVQDVPLLATDMNEVVMRGALPKKFQDVLWHPGNCLVLSQWFHQDAKYSFHRIGWEEWAMDLLFLVRTPEEISEFVESFEAVSHHTEPAILEMKRRLAG